MESSQYSARNQSPDHSLSLLLLGPPRILMNGEIAAIDRHKAVALLAYLAVTGVEHHRDTLAEMFWPEFDRTRARAALRRALASLTRSTPGPWWKINRETLGFHDCPGEMYFDVRVFRDHLCAAPMYENAVDEMCQDCLDSLTAAVQLYQGQFMEGFTLADSPAFDDFQRHQGEELRQDLIRTIERLARCHVDRAEYETAIRYGKRWVRIDALDEQARLILMQVYWQAGQSTTALREYEEYARLLQVELGVAPQDKLVQLYETIKADHTGAIPKSSEVWEPTRQITSKPLRLAHPNGSPKQDQMVGRETELDLAEAAWQRATQGKPSVLMVTGEPGMGKSHLVRELKVKLTSSGGQTLEGGCDPEGGLPYACFRQVVLEGITRFHIQGRPLNLPTYVLADLARLAPEVLAIYPDTSPNPRLDLQSEQQRSFDSIFYFCKATIQALRAPLLLVLEDLHWADTGSLRLMRHLAYRARVEQLPLLIVITLRDTEIDLEAESTLRDLLAELSRSGLIEPCPLHPLDFEHTRDLIRLIFEGKAEIMEGLVEAVQQLTEGNPFFIGELCQALIEEGRLHERSEVGRLVEDIQIPASIRGVVLGRVKHLSGAAQHVLLQAAFLGKQFDPDALFGLCDLDDETVIRALEEAGQARLIYETTTPQGLHWTFAHILIPLALCESISGLRRRRAHQRVADFLAVYTPEDTSTLAYHYAEANNHPKAIKYAWLAARTAMGLNAYEDALKYLRAALGLLKNSAPSEMRLTILEDYGDVYRQIGEGSQAVAVYQEAQDTWRSLPQRERWTGVRLQRKVGETVTNLNQHAEVNRLAPISRAGLEAGLADIKGLSPHPEKVRLLAALSRDAWYMRSQPDWAAAERYATLAVETSEALDQPVEVSIALEALAAVYGLKGKLRERVDLCQHRLDMSFDARFIDLKERVNIYLQTGMALYDVGEYLIAMEHLREAESLGRQIWDIPRQADALVRQAQCLFRLDRWDDVLVIEAEIQGLQSRFTHRRMGVLTCFFYAIQSAVYTYRGETDLGEKLKAEAHGLMLSITGPEQTWLRNQHF